MAIAPMLVHPRFLESNATSHVSPFSAIAELIDNAYDPDVDAKELCIDQTYVSGVLCLLFKDNGNGMDNEHLYKMLCLGYCEKDQFSEGETHKPIGQYGNGFKSGSMRLSKDALVFTVCKESAGIGFLSRTYLEAEGAASATVPLLKYKVPELKRIDDGQSGPNLKAILTHSPFKTEEKLLDELRDISKAVADKRATRSGIPTGTKIYLFNLKTLQNGRQELDFQSDQKDIKHPDISAASSDTTDHLVSLRKYCGILFIKPRMNIIIRGQWVARKIISRSLSRKVPTKYTPKESKYAFKILFGFTDEDEYKKGNYGILLYNRNRLIKTYEKVGYQTQPTGKGLGVVGVVEVDCLTPTHNKQDFMKDEKLDNVMKTLGTKLNKYWDEQPKDVLELLRKENKKYFNWICCKDCHKVRKVPCGIENVEWTCSMNADTQYNRCDIEEEPDSENPTKRTRKRNTSNEQQNAKKRSTGKTKGKEAKQASGESSRNSEDPEKECTFSTESDAHEEDVREQMEEDQHGKLGSAGTPVATTDTQQSGPRDNLNAHNATLQSTRLQPSEQKTLHDADRPSGHCEDYSFDGTDMETSNPVGHYRNIPTRQAVHKKAKVANRGSSSLSSTRKNNVSKRSAIWKNNSGSKKASPKPVKAQVNPVPQTPASASNQKDPSRSTTNNTMEWEAPTHQQLVDLKSRFDTFKSKVHDLLSRLKPGEDHGSVDEIENTVDKILNTL